ncbi:MAG: metal ABC transporter ATP-binding protein [Candidatus Omnitrophica bacterium]|nr:metal ABC transporter ATP-binding protein [Candidatus Omnitrophota bacterium]
METNSCKHCCIKVEGLSVTLGRRAVLDNINIHVNCAELIAIVGPNGAGKTTLLRAILGEVPYRGAMRMQIEGRARKDIRIGYVPQKCVFDIDSPVSVLDLVAAGVSKQPVWLGVNGRIQKKAEIILDKVEAGYLLKRRLGELSGGELQRVLLAIAMWPVPNLLLLDEPIANMDPKGLSLFYEIVTRLKKSHDVAILMVTHDLVGVAPHADRLLLLNRSVIAEGKPEEVLKDKALIRTLGPHLWNISKIPINEG